MVGVYFHIDMGIHVPERYIASAGCGYANRKRSPVLALTWRAGTPHLFAASNYASCINMANARDVGTAAAAPLRLVPLSTWKESFAGLVVLSMRDFSIHTRT